MPQATAQPPDPRLYNKALRLTFEYEGSAVRLVSAQSVEMILPASHATEPDADAAGFSFTLDDPAGKSVYRRATENPIRYDREVFSNDEKSPTIRRVAAQNPKGAFVLLVPDVPGVRTVRLFNHPLQTLRGTQPVREVARFDIREDQIQEGKKQ